MSNTRFDSSFGSLQLYRRPRRRNEVLQAWDNADHYLLNNIAESPPPAGARLLIVNDSFGALACALSDYDCVAWSDSAVSHLATQENCGVNGRSAPALLSSSDIPSGDFARVLYRLPRNHSLMRYQLQHLAPLLPSPAAFCGAIMAKYLDAATMGVVSDSLGEAAASLAWKKARLIRLNTLRQTQKVDDDWLPFYSADYQLQLGNRGNVFSRGKLDRGSRLLIASLSQLGDAERIADLGCGNGLLGLMAARHWPNAPLDFFDESYMAVDSAQRNWRDNGGAARAQFHAGDCLHGYHGETFDLILCNPPFHQEQQLGDHIAQQMFSDARRFLRPGGRLCVVGNRHLNYHISLKKRFGNCRVINSDAKFVVLVSTRQ